MAPVAGRDLPPTKALLGRLVLSPRSEEGSISRFLQETPAAAADPNSASLPDRRPVKKGDWYFFYNHPAYALKHPAGAGQGENAICMDATPGRQRWAGLGISANNESEMLKVLADIYNEPRTEQDYLWLLEQFAAKVLARKPPSQTYQETYRRLRNKRLIPDPYREEKGAFPTRDITWEDILKAPAIQVDGEPRRGGFSIRSGKTLRM